MATLSRTPPRPLIVDDGDDLRPTPAQRFPRPGITAAPPPRRDEAAPPGGEGAVQGRGDPRFDVALLDLHLPGMSGIDVLGKLKALQPEVEALLLTAQGSIETAVQAVKGGAYDYLTKPFRLAELEVH